MAPASAFTRDESGHLGTSGPEERGAMDFSHDSDDSSDRASHGIKRGGNNHFGSTGILKCLTCRKRKGKCEYNDPSEACRFCSDRSLQCGNKLSAKGARAHELSQQLLSLQREAGMVPFPDTSKLSAISAELERRFPHATVGEIYAMAKPTVENAIAVAAGQGSRNDVLFANPQLSDPSVAIHSQLSSARHTPVQKDTRFNRSPSQPHLVQSHQQQQPQQLPPSSRSAEGTPSYDMDSWFSTFPPQTQSQPQATDTSDFTQFQPNLPEFATTTFYTAAQSRPRQRQQHPPVHTNEAEIDYASLFGGPLH